MPHAAKPPPLLATTLATARSRRDPGPGSGAQGRTGAADAAVEISRPSLDQADGSTETALPVQIITREQIQRSGATNVESCCCRRSARSRVSGGLTAASASGATTGGISAAPPDVA